MDNAGAPVVVVVVIEAARERLSEMILLQRDMDTAGAEAHAAEAPAAEAAAAEIEARNAVHASVCK